MPCITRYPIHKSSDAFPRQNFGTFLLYELHRAIKVVCVCGGGGLYISNICSSCNYVEKSYGVFYFNLTFLLPGFTFIVLFRSFFFLTVSLFGYFISIFLSNNVILKPSLCLCNYVVNEINKCSLLIYILNLNYNNVSTFPRAFAHASVKENRNKDKQSARRTALVAPTALEHNGLEKDLVIARLPHAQVGCKCPRTFGETVSMNRDYIFMAHSRRV